jgi:hypothetical protein
MQRLDQIGFEARGVRNGNAGVDADHLHMRNRREFLNDFSETFRVKCERVAAGEDYLPDLGVLRNPREGAGEGGWIEKFSAWPNLFAAETKTAVHGAGV